MGKIIKTVAIILGALVLGVVVLAIALVLLIDPNDYKDEITQAVKEKTGRELQVEGNLKLSLFPWIGLEIGAAELANAPGFGKDPMARILSAGVRVEVLPLLRRELVIDTVRLDGLKLNLARNRDGQTNWDDLIAAEPKEPAGPAPAKKTPAAGLGIAALTIGAITVRNGEIDWRDEATRTHYAVRDLAFTSGKIEPGKPADLRADFVLESGDSAGSMRVALNTRANLHVEEQTLDVAKLELTLDEMALSGSFKARQILDAPVAQGKVDVPAFNPRALIKKLSLGIEVPPGDALNKLGLKSTFEVDLGRQTLTLSDLSLTVDEMVLSGRLKGNQIRHAPLLQGTVDVPPFNPRPFVALLAPGFQPGTKNALTRLSLRSDFSADLGRKTLNLSKLALTIDDIALTADLEGRNLVDKPRFTADLVLPGFRPAVLVDLLGLNVATAYKNAISQASLKARLSADLAREALDISSLSLTADGIELSGNAQARQFRQAPEVSGHVDIQPLNLRKLLTRFAVEYNSADRRTLANVSLKSDFSASARHATLTKLHARFDETALAGSLAIQNFDKPAYSFDLKLDQLDLDRYLPAPPAPAPGAKDAGRALTPGGVPAALPLETLRDLRLDGHAAISKLKAFGLRSSQVDVRLKAQGGALTIGPNQAKLYGGRYDGQTVINARGKVPEYVIQEKLTGIDLGPFLKDAAIYDKLSGKGMLSLNLNAHGFDGSDITRTLSGNMTVDVRDGKIEGINLQQSINQARAQYAQLRGKPVPVLPDASDATVFTRLSGNAVLKNGVAINNDLKMDGANLRATGKGTVNLPAQSIKYRLHVTVAEEASRQGTTVPVDVTGSLAEPTYSVAWNEVLKDQVEKKIEQKKEEKKQELEDKLKEKLRKKYKLF